MYGQGEFADLHGAEGLQTLLEAADSAGPAHGAQSPGLDAQGGHDVANADQIAASPDRQVTPRAFERLAEIGAAADGKALRIAVEGGGCSGFKYSFGFEDKSNNDDILFNKIIIDKASLDIISGSIVDFKKEMLLSAEKAAVWMRTTKIGTKSFVLEYAVVSEKNGDTVVHATGTTTQIMFDMKSRSTVEVAGWVRDALTNFEK